MTRNRYNMTRLPKPTPAIEKPSSLARKIFNRTKKTATIIKY